MDNELRNRFDASIKNALQDHQVPYDDRTWEMLESKMQATELSEDASLDQAAKNALSDYKVPYDHTTWAPLSERLDRINYRNRLIVAKFFEAAVIFFTVFTMIKFLGNIPDVKDYLPMPFAQTETGQLDQLPEAEVAKKASDLLISDAIEKDNSQFENELKAKVAVAKADLDLADAKSDLTAKLPPGKNLVDAAHWDVYQVKTVKAMKATLSYLEERRTNQRSDASVAWLERRKAYLPSVVRNIEAQHTTPSVPLLPAFDLTMITAETASDFHIVAVDRVPKVITKLNLFYQYNVHNIENVARGSESYNQPEHSNGIGFSANVQFGNVGFDLGAVYDEVKYDAGFGRNEIHKIQIPLNLRYSGLKTKYADFYLKGGASVHGISQAHYEAPVLANASAPGSPRARIPHFNDGLLNDGNKVENIYFTANFGAGLDVSMTKSFSLFAETMYQHRFQGEIGLTSDKFKTFATNFGVSYSFR